MSGFLYEVIRLIRVKQWTKNAFVFAPLLFSLNLFNEWLWIDACWTFLAFSMVSSTVYVFNDIIDIERDRIHPIKRSRPLAAGVITIGQAWITAGICLLVAVIISLRFGTDVTAVLGIYLVLNIFYSLKGKDIIILDTMIIALGFVLRVLAGAYAIEVLPSSWMLVATFFLALLLGLGKRYNEIFLSLEEPTSFRRVLEDYNEPLLRQMLSIASSSTVVSYALYTMDSHVIGAFGTNYLVFTLPFVVFGVFRYLYLVFKHNQGGDPTEEVFGDKTMLMTLTLWLISVIYIIY